MNQRITKRERGLIKGAINRVFPRSELYKQAIDKLLTLPYHKDPKRKRVKTWKLCQGCGKPNAKSDFQVDHIDPRVPINKSFEDMSFDEYINRTWCDLSNLMAICKTCHSLKSKRENKERRALKKVKKS